MSDLKERLAGFPRVKVAEQCKWSVGGPVPHRYVEIGGDTEKRPNTIELPEAEAFALRDALSRIVELEARAERAEAVVERVKAVHTQHRGEMTTSAHDDYTAALEDTP